jgi:hypothetical protein
MSVSGSRRLTRIVLGVVLVWGMSHALTFPFANPPQVGLATDVYHHVGTAVLDGQSFYGVHPPDHPRYRFLYPPPIVLATIPYALVGSEVAAYALGWLTNGIAVVLLARFSIASIRQHSIRLDRIDIGLIGGFFILSAPAVTTLVIGQVNLLLLSGIAGGALALEAGRDDAAGLAFGLPALVKLFPALTGAWLLRRQAWRTIVAATATGVGGLALGLVVFGVDPSVTYLTSVLPGELAVGAFPQGPDAEAPYMGLRRQFSVLVPGLGHQWLLPAAILVVAPFVVASYRSMQTLVDRFIALEATLVAMVLVLPLEPFYVALVAFPTVPLLYLVDDEVAERLFLAGTILSTAPITYSGLLRWAGYIPEGRALLGPVLRPLFEFMLPAGLGLWCLLCACVLVQRRSVRAQTRTS